MFPSDFTQRGNKTLDDVINREKSDFLTQDEYVLKRTTTK